MIKIGVVGPEESKWKPEQIPKTKSYIRDIFNKYASDTLTHGPYKPLVLVSGHCPKFGVDIWAEEVADKLGIKKEIYAPEVNQWEDKIFPSFGMPSVEDKKQKGYRSRNIDMAKVCDICYCIVPRAGKGQIVDVSDARKYNRNIYCIHCKEFGHPTNGGCWTMKYAEKLGKEVHLAVIG